jgi:hypothetical protein
MSGYSAVMYQKYMYRNIQDMVFKNKNKKQY